MVHRDIKPNNLILGRKSVVKILDFGLAKVRQEEGGDTGLTGTNVMMGTPDYMAPEQWSDARNVDIRADIYSLGCTLYYLLTGRPPFVVKNSAEAVAAHTLKQPQPVNELRPEVPAGLAAVVARMLAKDPARALPDAGGGGPRAGAVHQGRDEAARCPDPIRRSDGPAMPQPPKRRPKPQPESGRRVGMWVAVALVGLLLLVVYLECFLPRSANQPGYHQGGRSRRGSKQSATPLPSKTIRNQQFPIGSPFPGRCAPSPWAPAWR